jgi:hypothetical protein
VVASLALSSFIKQLGQGMRQEPESINAELDHESYPKKIPGVSYERLTAHVAEQIQYFMADALRHRKADAVARRERAYGLYIGWRALAAEMSATDFARDDLRLEAMVNATQTTE